MTPPTYLAKSSLTRVDIRVVKPNQNTQIRVPSGGAGKAGRPSTAKQNATMVATLAVVQEITLPPHQVIQRAHTDALKLLSESTQQRNFDRIFTSILVLDGTKKGDFFEWI